MKQYTLNHIPYVGSGRPVESANTPPRRLAVVAAAGGAVVVAGGGLVEPVFQLFVYPVHLSGAA